MKELQKYYAHAEHLSVDRPVDIEWGSHEHVYLASEADAAFEEMRRERAEEIERLKAEHKSIIKRLQNAARSGMAAAHAISYQELQLAQKLSKESKPELVESERNANAILTEENEELRERVDLAIELAVQYGGIDGAHHKTWVIDQMVRALAGSKYESIVADAKSGEDGPDTYEWDEGIAP